ncbi:hypothetical protein HZH68_015687 [Vespula germanica]|uniref:Uncharacterized protein n=2 Tax=Vespula TaxID=7451 RepID=A0A834MSA2_VESGE|nr:hypothetical protein HZH66_014265 [Vespula vulgaris]KAF7381814.1 hypothetical protein HZH68_015687 [Vespula germanica]
MSLAQVPIHGLDLVNAKMKDRRKSADSVWNIRCRRPFIEEGVDFPPVVAVKKVGREGVKVMEWIVRKKKEFWGTGEVMVLEESEV